MGKVLFIHLKQEILHSGRGLERNNVSWITAEEFYILCLKYLSIKIILRTPLATGSKFLTTFYVLNFTA